MHFSSPLLWAALVVAQLVVATLAEAQTSLPAFPGAEGSGRMATGGRGGDVYHVTNLNDSGPGSLREGLATAAGPRTIVFDVSGNIRAVTELRVGSALTLAGQTAPGDGFTICDRMTYVEGTNIIIRFLRFRPGDTYCPYEPDALWVARSTNVIIDHVSASWGIDETLSTTHGSHNVTVQWSLITEALKNSCHSKGSHGYGSLIDGGDFTFHHNLYAHNDARNPRPGTSSRVPGTRLDFVNNIIYNPGWSYGYTTANTYMMYMNFVGNYGISDANTSATALFSGSDGTTAIFQSGNFMDTDKDGVLDGTAQGWGTFSGSEVQLTARVDLSPVSTGTANQAFHSVLNLAGASRARDQVDQRVIASVISQTGGHINSQSQVGGWPALASAPAPLDTDQDGLPDFWESALSLNPADPADRNAIGLTGYTRLEEYLNWLAEPHAVCEANRSVDVNLWAATPAETNLTFTFGNATNGTVTLLGDGFTARFFAAPGASGLAGFTFTATHPASATTFGPMNYGILIVPGTNSVLLATTTALGISPNPAAVGSNVTFTATVRTNGIPAASATGWVSFQSGATHLGSSPVSGGQAVFDTSGLGYGSHLIKAAYSGDAALASSISPPLAQIISTNTSTTTALAASPNPSFVGSNVTFTATVKVGGNTPLSARGQMVFKSGDMVLSTNDVTGGVAVFSTDALPYGSHLIRAEYRGYGIYLASISAPLAQVVIMPPPILPPTLSWSVSNNSLMIAWPADFLGWVLQSQTSALEAGLNTNWADLAGTEFMISTNVPIDPEAPVKLYRLRQRP